VCGTGGCDVRNAFAVLFIVGIIGSSCAAEINGFGSAMPALPENARLVLNEDWSGGMLAERWYSPRNKWGAGNNGVVRENVRVERDIVNGHEQNVLVCEAHGDHYSGSVLGYQRQKTRVGGVLISKAFFASGRFEIVVKIGSSKTHAGGPDDPFRPKGMVPAMWTYAYRYVKSDSAKGDVFAAAAPMYNPFLKARDGATNEYTSEIDFPEFGKQGNFDQGLYNAYTQNRADNRVCDVSPAIDGGYHVFTTQWRTKLVPIDATDAQVVESEGYWWVQDKAIPYGKYSGNPLKRLGKDRYAVYSGDVAEHWLDGKKIGENTKNVPSMAAQLTLGTWLPFWAGEAKWETATVSVASVKIWQYDDAGDVRGILTSSLRELFDEHGNEIPRK